MLSDAVSKWLQMKVRLHYFSDQKKSSRYNTLYYKYYTINRTYIVSNEHPNDTF